MASYRLEDSDTSLAGSAYNDSFTIEGDNDTVYGGEGGDVMDSRGSHNLLYGEADNDSLTDIFGGQFNVLDGGTGDDKLVGHATDTLIGGDGADAFEFTAHDLASGITANFTTLGTDPVIAYSWGEFDGLEKGTFGATTHDDILLASATGVMTLYGDDGNDEITGSDGANSFLIGGAGSDFLKAGDGGASLYAFDNGGKIEDLLNVSQATDLGADTDTLRGGAGNDYLYMGYGSELISGGDGDDLLILTYLTHVTTVINLAKGSGSNSEGDHYKFSGIERVVGGKLADLIVGTDANNELKGMDGDDTLQGGLGADALTGGLGGDTFLYRSAADSALGASDSIWDLSSGDTLDLHFIDANANKTGNQTFKLVDSFSGHAGELMVSYDWKVGTTTVDGDTDGDGTADFHLWILGDVSHATLVL